MAGFFHARQAGDLALGKPPLLRFLKSASVGEALRALKKCNELDLSLWEELCPLTEKPIKDNSSHAHGIGREAVAGVRHNPVACRHSDEPNCLQGAEERLWRCVGKVGMVDIICFLAQDESLANLSAALKSPVASLFPDASFVVQHVDSQTKLFDALGHILDGAQNLVVSIDRSISSRLARYNSMPNPRRGVAQMINKPKREGKHLDCRQLSLPPISRESGVLQPAAQEYCWLTPEDIVRFLLSCIGLFAPLPMMDIEQLGIINTDVLTVDVKADAIMALPLTQKAAREMTAVAVVEEEDDELKLVGEISAFTMNGCDETAALALATLSMRDFLSFTQDCGGPPDSLVELMQSRICQKLKNVELSNGSLLSDSDSPLMFPSPLRDSAPILLATIYSLSSGEDSSDEDSVHSPTGRLGSLVPSARLSRGQSISKGRMAPNTCRPWSSLVAVMAQALTHRVGYIWVTTDDNTLLGIVTYLDIVNCILSHLYSSE